MQRHRGDGYRARDGRYNNERNGYRTPRRGQRYITKETRQNENSINDNSNNNKNYNSKNVNKQNEGITQTAPQIPSSAQPFIIAYPFTHMQPPAQMNAPNAHYALPQFQPQMQENAAFLGQQNNQQNTDQMYAIQQNQHQMHQQQQTYQQQQK